MENNKKIIWLVSALVIVLAIVLYFKLSYKKSPKASSPVATTGNTPPAIKNLTPIKGALPPNFPVAILAGTSPTIVASGYTFDQVNKLDVWVVNAISAKKLDVFAGAYGSYFKTNKWTVIKNTQTPAQLYYFAFDPKSGENVSVNITIMPNSISNISLTLKQPHAK